MALYVRPTLGQTIDSGSVTVGKYTRVDRVTSAWAGTGSNAGGSAVIVANSVSAGNINLVQGGTLLAADVDGLGVIECQPISIDSVAGGNVYVLYGASR
tara:strand:- start:1662 stop:1958 length:297 start_codon:yes stop_codon:yes gene_type:complete